MKLDAVDAYREGHQAGQEMVLDLINRFARFEAKTIAELVQLICKVKIEEGEWE